MPSGIDGTNDKLYLREVDTGGTSYHRIVALNHGNYSIGSLAVGLQQ